VNTFINLMAAIGTTCTMCALYALARAFLVGFKAGLHKAR